MQKRADSFNNSAAAPSRLIFDVFRVDRPTVDGEPRVFVASSEVFGPGVDGPRSFDDGRPAARRPNCAARINRRPVGYPPECRIVSDVRGQEFLAVENPNRFGPHRELRRARRHRIKVQEAHYVRVLPEYFDRITKKELQKCSSSNL